jgi:hypothetical protein
MKLLAWKSLNSILLRIECKYTSIVELLGAFSIAYIKSHKFILHSLNMRLSARKNYDTFVLNNSITMLLIYLLLGL